MNHNFDDGIAKIKQVKNKFIIFIIGIVIYLAGILAFSIYSHFDNRKTIIAENDLILSNAAMYIPVLLDDDLYDGTVDNEMTQEEYYSYVMKLTGYCKSMNLKSLFTVVQKTDGFYFTSSSATEEELKNGRYVKYKEKYDDATSSGNDALSQDLPPRKRPANLFHGNSGEKIFTEYSNKWGGFRSVVIICKSKNGIIYYAAANMDIRYLRNLISRSLVKTVIAGLFFLILILPLFILQYRNLKKEIKVINDRRYHDILTGLPNRNRLNIDIMGLSNPNVFQINIDFLKSINDYYGYSAGDFIIREMANRILFFLVSEEFSLYKIESDEYAILLDKSITKSEAETLARFFIESISERPFIYGENEIHVTVTIGVALYCYAGKNVTKNDVDFRMLVVNSDLALKNAVSSKKNFFIFDCSTVIKNDFDNNIAIIKILKESIKNDMILPYYQPIMNNVSGRIEKYESLIRINDNGKILTPGNFLDISKKSKFYHKLTRIIIHKAYENMKNHDFEFSINISINDILDEETHIFLKLKLEENRMYNRRIVFELLESEGIENYDEVKQFIDMIKGYDCKIAIDDFGSGYSNFGHLIKLNVDYIKLDAMIIKNIDKDRNNAVIAKNINSFAHELGIKTIAEYVHSKQVLEIVKEIGIDFSQGYYIGEPKENVVSDESD